MKKTMKHARKKRASVIGVCVVLVLMMSALVGVGSFAAKYVFKGETQAFSAAKNFYLESDLLADSNSAMPRYTLQAGVDTIDFKLMNYPDDLRVSEVDIQCTVTVASGGTTVATREVTLSKNAQDAEALSFEVDPGTYVVTVSNSQPYAKTLHAQFTVVGLDGEVEFSVNDGVNSPNLKVTVWTTDYEGYVKITLPASGVLPDNTDPLMATATSSNCTIYVLKNSEYTLQFFKTDPSAVYTNAISVAPAQSA